MHAEVKTTAGRLRGAVNAGVASFKGVPFTFDTVYLLSPTDRDAPAYTLAATMSATWAAFTRTGTPDHSSIPVWPPSALDRRATLVWTTIAVSRTIPVTRPARYGRRSRPLSPGPPGVRNEIDPHGVQLDRLTASAGAWDRLYKQQ